MAKKQKAPWLPRKGKRVEVTHPVTGRKVGVPERTGFAIVMIFAGLLIAVAVVLYFRSHG